jgi:hypothetical protein
VEQGEEGDLLAFTLYWPVKVATLTTYLLSALLVFGLKSLRSDASGTEGSSNAADYLIGLICPLALVGIAFGNGLFENYVLEKLTGARWPGDGTQAVDRYLPLRTENDRQRFDGGTAAGFAVSLFDTINEGIVTEIDGRKYYVESANRSPYATRLRRDEEVRKTKQLASAENDYTITQLFDHAGRMAALLSMAALNYDGASPQVRSNVAEIFKGWDLDYRTVDEWDELMKASAGADMGLLQAAKRWWDDISLARPVDPTAVERLEQGMAVTGFSATLNANFDHVHPAPDAVGGRSRRLVRPGAIILANLDIDDTIAAPPPAPAPLPDRLALIDAVKDDSVNANSDEREMAFLQVRRPTRPGLPTYDLTLRLHADDAKRVRVFAATGTPDTWPRHLGAASGSGSPTETSIVAASDTVDFRIEALTLPGDPLLKAPVAPAPFGRDGVTPVVTSRAAGDVWIELLHRTGGADVPGLRDVALFTIAPYLMFSNLQPTVLVYVVYFKDILDSSGNRSGLGDGNHATVADLVEGIDAALAPLPTGISLNSANEFVPHKPLPPGDVNAARGLYIIDGSAYFDQWIQDEIEIGYCWAPAQDAWMHMTIHTPRRRQLRDFVHREIPGPGMGLFDSLNHQWDSLNYGGNLEVSPPVNEALTTPLPAGLAGLAVPAQEAAPFGKILCGEGLIPISTLDSSIIADLDAGGIPSSAVIAEFNLSHIGILISEITVNSAGTEWEIAFVGPVTERLRVRLESGALNVYLIQLAGDRFITALTFTPPVDQAAVISDLDAGGHPSERLQDTFNDSGLDLPVPQITVRSAGNEWLLTLAGERGRTLLLIRREGGHLRLYSARILEPSFRNFLAAQGVQPIFTFDTSWLHVGHVDEVMIFVPSNAVKGYALLMSSTQLATAILEGAQILHITDAAAHPLTELFRGKEWVRRTASGARVEVDATVTVDDLLTSHRDSNDELQTERLTPIENRLVAGLKLHPTDDIIHIPVYFDAMPLGSIGSGGLTSAHTPGMVNLQVFNHHVMVPRPFGPRMNAADVVSVLSGADATLSIDVTRLSGLIGHWHWAVQDEQATAMATTFGVGAAAIRSHTKNSGKFNAAGAVRKNWDRIWIPEDNVDLFEAYVQLKLEAIGLTVHWIDDWDTYHRELGEVHCGTNVIRTPPEAAPGYSGPYWWDHYYPT